MQDQAKDFSIRTTLKAGDLGEIVRLHGIIYNQEQDFGVEFEAYVAESLGEFYRIYQKSNSRIWLYEYNNKIVGVISLLDRGKGVAQLRYFLVRPEFRGYGLGKKLMQLFMDFFHEQKFKAAYLSTAKDLTNAAHLYLNYGFKLTQEENSAEYGRETTVQRYDFIPNESN